MAARANIAVGVLKPSIKPSFFFSSLAGLSPADVFCGLLGLGWGVVAGSAVVGKGDDGVEMFIEGLLSEGKEIVSVYILGEEEEIGDQDILKVEDPRLAETKMELFSSMTRLIVVVPVYRIVLSTLK